MKYFIILSISLLSLACSKKHELKSFEFEEIVPQNESFASEREVIAKFPIIKVENTTGLDLQAMGISISSSFSRTLDTKRESYIRTKMKSIVEYGSSEKLSVDDIFKFQFRLADHEKVKLFQNLRFQEVENYKARVNTSFKLSSSLKEGMVKDLAYKISYVDKRSNNVIDEHYENIYRYENQREAIDLADIKSDSYTFESEEFDYSLFTNRIISGKSMVYEIVDYFTNDKSLREWKEESMKSCALVLISFEGKQEYLFIKSGESLEDALRDYDKSFEVSVNGNIKVINDQKGDWSKIGFTKINRKVRSGEVFGIYLKNNTKKIEVSTKRIQSLIKKQEVVLEQDKEEEIELFIQMNSLMRKKVTTTRNEVLSNVIYSGCSSIMEDCQSVNTIGTRPEACEVTTDKVETSDLSVHKVSQDDILFNIDEQIYSLRQLQKLKMVEVYEGDEVIHIVIKKFKGLEDIRTIKLYTSLEAVPMKIRTDVHACTVGRFHSSQSGIGRYNFFMIEANISKREVYEVNIGKEKFLNAYVVR